MTETTRIDVTGAAELAAHSTRLLDGGHRLALIAAHHDDSATMRVVYLYTAGPPDRRTELILRTDARRPQIPSLAAFSYPASRFEREIRDLFGIQPTNHPMPKPLVHHPHWPRDWHPMRRDNGHRPVLAAVQPFPFLTVDGDGVYEIPVGPVHAGLIEPGHFRFSVVGETILNLKARLWYVHKGIEKLAEGKPINAGLQLAERVSGDTAVGHSLAYTHAVEAGLCITVPRNVAIARAALLELERLHNHIADIGALCNDVAYGIAHAHTQRIRETLLRLNKATTGHRLLRGGFHPGGASLTHLPESALIRAIAADIEQIVDITLGHSVIRERFTGTAVLTRQQAVDTGALGYVAKASGIPYDARVAHPHCELGEAFAIPTRDTGDVLARFLIRADETQISAAILQQLLPTLRTDPSATTPPLNTTGQTVSGIGIVEGWRGTIVHRIEIGPDSRISRWKIVDPSFLNWPALPLAMTDTIVPDFPLANKSFNLSYAGNDL